MEDCSIGHIAAVWVWNQTLEAFVAASCLSAKFDCPVARQNCSLLPYCAWLLNWLKDLIHTSASHFYLTAHDCETGLKTSYTPLHGAPRFAATSQCTVLPNALHHPDISQGGHLFHWTLGTIRTYYAEYSRLTSGASSVPREKRLRFDRNIPYWWRQSAQHNNFCLSQDGGQR